MEAAAQKQPSPQAGLDGLRRQVLEPGLCVVCGGCVGLCPHLALFDGQVAAPDDCGLERGRCLEVCPQALGNGLDQQRDALLRSRGQAPSPPLGPVLEAWWGWATAPDLAQRAQYGGVVSTLAALALEQGLIGEAILTQAGTRGAPEGLRALSRADVIAAAGSIYAGGGALAQLNQALAEPESHALGLVGLPCQALAANSMRALPDYPQAQRLKLVIGLFCTLNLSARGLRGVLKQAGVSEPVLRADFPPPPAGVLEVTSARGMTRIPLEQVRPATLAGCALCPDLTAELADVSVGAAEGQPGLNTVIARTPQGRELVELARQRGLLELQPVPAESWSHLSTAAANKRARATQAWQERHHV